MTVRPVGSTMAAIGFVLVAAACVESSGPPTVLPAPSAPPTSSVVTPPTGPPDPPPTPGASPRASHADRALFDALRAGRGVVRLVVTVAVAHVPEAELPDPAAVRRQRDRIADVQRRLLAELAPYQVEVLTRYERLPQLALTVDEPALRHLIGSPLVVHIQPDRPDSTTD
ncbi:hypothetical protein [Plantactinospora sp. B5E13]|uniref:hypothetical protein n=1 Tax=unclassified Plantactinospora TaxID=2631981 RepID=UPI00325CC501